MRKMQLLSKNGIFGKKWNFWRKMEFLAKNGIIGEKWIFWQKI